MTADVIRQGCPVNELKRIVREAIESYDPTKDPYGSPCIRFFTFFSGHFSMYVSKMHNDRKNKTSAEAAIEVVRSLQPAETLTIEDVATTLDLQGLLAAVVDDAATLHSVITVCERRLFANTDSHDLKRRFVSEARRLISRSNDTE